MAERVKEGFETDTTILAGKGMVLQSTPAIVTTQRHRTLSGQGGNQALECNSSGDGIRIPAVSVGVAEEIVVAVRFTSGSPARIFFDLAVSQQCAVDIGTDGFVRLYRGNTITLLATSATTLAANAWHWLKIVVTAREAASAGRIQVFVGGSGTAFVDTGAGVDCRQLATDDFDSVRLILPTGSGPIWWDDYHQGSSGTFLNKKLFVQITRPTADSTPIDGTPSTGTDRFAVVDESPASAVDYIEDLVAGGENRFTFGALAFTPLEVFSVQPIALMTGEGTFVHGRTVVRSGGSDSYGTNQVLATGGTYAVVKDIFPLDPAGNPWTGTTVGTIVAGYEVNT